MANDRFEFKLPSGVGGIRQYRCAVETEFFPGDGFAVVNGPQHLVSLVPGGGVQRDGAEAARSWQFSGYC